MQLNNTARFILYAVTIGLVLYVFFEIFTKGSSSVFMMTVASLLVCVTGVDFYTRSNK